MLFGTLASLSHWHVNRLYVVPCNLTACRVAQSIQRLATGWTVRGSNPGGGEIFRTCPDRPWGPPSLLHNGYRVFPGVKERLGRDANPSPLLVPWSRKSTAIPLFTLRAVRPEPQCLYRGTLYLYFLRNLTIHRTATDVRHTPPKPL